jgi:hypothetical protein
MDVVIRFVNKQGRTIKRFFGITFAKYHCSYIKGTRVLFAKHGLSIARA